LARFGSGKGGAVRKQKKINPGERSRRPLLALGRIAYFKYDLNEIMDRSDIDDGLLGSFKASIIAKSSKISIQDAKDYITQIEKESKINPETSSRICHLLDRYTRYR
jgi:hypothetical protein